MRRGQGIGINVVIVAAIALLVLVIIGVIVMQGGINLRRGSDGCVANGGKCFSPPGPSNYNEWRSAPEYDDSCGDQTRLNAKQCYIYRFGAEGDALY